VNAPPTDGLASGLIDRTRNPVEQANLFKLALWRRTPA
jgi:hypothetical protein